MICFSVWWDTTNALGYYLALLPQIGTSLSYMTTIGIVITFFGGICTYIEACVDDMSTIIPQMNEIAITSKNRNNERIGLKLQQTITDMIQLHADTLRYELLI